MGDFHIPNDPNWQWAYDAILYTIGEQFPKGDPSELEALGVKLDQFGRNLLSGMAATQSLGAGLRGNLDGPAADAFAQFQKSITHPIPSGTRKALTAGYIANLANEKIDYGQVQIVTAAFTIVLSIASAMATGFGASLVPAYLRIGQKWAQDLLNGLQSDLLRLSLRLAAEAAGEAAQEGAENVAAQAIVIAKDNKSDGFDFSDFFLSVGAGAWIGGVAGGVHQIGGKFFPKFSGTSHGQAGSGVIGELLGEYTFMLMLGAGGEFNPLATAVSSAVGSYADRYAQDLGEALGGGSGKPDASDLHGPGKLKNLAAAGTDVNGSGRPGGGGLPGGSGAEGPAALAGGDRPPARAGGHGPRNPGGTAGTGDVVAGGPNTEGGRPGHVPGSGAADSGRTPESDTTPIPGANQGLPGLDSPPVRSTTPGPASPVGAPSNANQPEGSAGSRTPDSMATQRLTVPPPAPVEAQEPPPVVNQQPAAVNPTTQHPTPQSVPPATPGDTTTTPGGMPATPAGTPTTPAGPAGTPTTPAGTPTTPATPGSTPATPTVPAGTPTTPAGTPATPAGTPTPPAGTPAVPADTSAGPAQPGGVSAEPTQPRGTSAEIGQPGPMPTDSGQLRAPVRVETPAETTGSGAGPLSTGQVAGTTATEPSGTTETTTTRGGPSATVGPVPDPTGRATPTPTEVGSDPESAGSVPVPVLPANPLQDRSLPAQPAEAVRGASSSGPATSGASSSGPASTGVGRREQVPPPTTAQKPLPQAVAEAPPPPTPEAATTVDGPGDARVPDLAVDRAERMTQPVPSSPRPGPPPAQVPGPPSDGGGGRHSLVSAAVTPPGSVPTLRDVPVALVAKSTAETPTAGDPIDVTTGRMIYAETDLSLPGLALERTHRSDYHWGRSFGPSWSSTLDQRVVTDGRRVWFLSADGSILTYPVPAEGGEALPLLGRPAALRRLAGGGWSLTQQDTVLLFAPAGDGREAVLSDVATARTRWHITRDDAGTPVLLESATGDRVRLRSRDGLVTGALFVSAGEVHDRVELPTFGYDDRRRLVEVRNSSGDPVRLDYDEDGRIVRWADRNGEWYSYAYDEAGRCVLADGNGGYLRYAFEYGDDVTIATDSLGGAHRYELNARRQVVAIVDPLGATTRLTWDAANRLLSRTDPLGRTTRFGYDGRGRPTVLTRPDGNTVNSPVIGARPHRVPGTIFDLDGLGRPRSARLPDGAVTEFGWTAEGDLASLVGPAGYRQEWHYDGEGNLVESTDAAGGTVRIEYGPFDLPTARVDEAGHRTEYAYDTELRLVAVTNPAGRVWRYAYDAAGRLTEETDFDGRTQRYARDAAGQLVAHTDPAGDTTHYAYDLLGRVTERRVGDAVTRLQYDAQGRIAAVLSPDAVVRFTRDEQGRVITETVNGEAVHTSYHPELGRVQARTTPSGRSSRWTFDADGRPESLTTGRHLMRFRHDAAGREISRTVDDVVALRQSFDAAGRLAAQRIADTAEREFRYDATGRITTIGDSHAGERSFHADEVGRVHTVTADGEQRERYAYDEAGNLAGTVGDRWEFDGTMLVRSDDARFEYDGKGRLVLRVDAAGVWRFGWDAEDRMVQVVTPGGDRWRYRYDGFGRRILKQRLASDDRVLEEVRFAWSGDLVVEQTHRDADGTTSTTSWDYRQDGSTPLAQRDGDLLRTVVTDRIGTPTHLVEATGALHWWSRSDLWGRGHGAATPLRFPGQYFDAETGLHYNRFRFYDPATARYLSPDPIGLAGGPNPTAYVPDPLTVADPLGLTNCTVTQPSLDPLGDHDPARPVTLDGEPSQLPDRAAPPPPEALYGMPPLAQVVTLQPDGSQRIRHEPRPALRPPSNPSTVGTSPHAHDWYSESAAAPSSLTEQLSSENPTLESIQRQLQPLPQSGPDVDRDDNLNEAPVAAPRRRGREDDEADYVAAPSSSRRPSAGPEAWLSSSVVRRALNEETSETSRWLPVQTALREYRELRRDDLDQRGLALRALEGSLHNWRQYHDRWDTNARTLNRSRIRRLNEIRRDLRALIQTEDDDIRSRRDRATTSRSVPTAARSIRGSRAAEPAAYTPFGTPAPANLNELRQEFDGVGRLPEGVQVNLHVTGLANYSAIRHEGLQPGAGSGIGLPGAGADSTFTYVLTGSLPTTTAAVTADAPAGAAPVGVLTTGTGFSRDVNYPGGAQQYGNPIPPARTYPAGDPTYSFTFPPTPQTVRGIADFINNQRAAQGRSTLSDDEAMLRVRAELFHRFRLHVADYLALPQSPATTQTADDDWNDNQTTDDNYYTEENVYYDNYDDYGRAPTGSRETGEVTVEQPGPPDPAWVSPEEIEALRRQVPPRVVKATTVFDVVEKQAKDPSIPQVVRDSYREAGLEVPDFAPVKPSIGAQRRDLAFNYRELVTADGRRIQDFELLLQLRPDDSRAAEVFPPAKREEYERVFSDFYNQKYRIGPKKDQFNFTMNLVDTAPHAHRSIRVTGGNAGTTQVVWSPDTTALDVVHEGAHFLGLFDQYLLDGKNTVLDSDGRPVRWVLRRHRPAPDNSIMTTIDAADRPELKQRDLDRISRLPVEVVPPDPGRSTGPEAVPPDAAPDDPSAGTEDGSTDYVSTPSRSRTPSAGPDAWLSSNRVRDTLGEETTDSSQWSSVQTALREYLGLRRDDLGERDFALNALRVSLDNWRAYHDTPAVRLRTLNRSRIRRLDRTRRQLMEMIQQERDDVRRQRDRQTSSRSRPTAAQSIRGSRAAERTVYTPFGTPTPANLTQLEQEFRRAGSLPPGVQVNLHVTGLANYSAIHNEGVRPGAGRGIGLPDGETDSTFTYVLTGSLPTTTAAVTADAPAGAAPVGVLTTGAGFSRDVNYPGGAQQYGNAIPPVRNYPAEDPTYSFTFPATPQTMRGIANFINDQRAAQGRPPLSEEEAVHRVRAELFHSFRLHVADYVAMTPEDPTTQTDDDWDDNQTTEDRYYTEEDIYEDNYHDYARAPRRTGEPATYPPTAPFTEVTPDAVAKSTEQTPTAADPIDVTTGRMILTETDVVLPGLTLERTYRSDYRWGRSFGRSWASTLDQRVVVSGDQVRYLAADGSILTYPLPAVGEVTLPQVGRALPLRRLVDGGWLLTDPVSGRALVFAPANDAESVLSDVAEGDLRWSIARDSAGTPIELRSSAGAQVGFSSASGRVTMLWLPNQVGAMQAAYQFEYDGEGNLVEVLNSSGDAERFDYTDGRIVRWEDRNGEWYSYTYDEAGRCVGTDGKGGHLRYRFEYQKGQTVVTDSLGAVRRYELNDRFQVVAETDALGATTRTEWDGANRLRSRTDPLGRTTTFDHDADGRCATVTRADGSQSTITYDEFGRPTSWRDFDGSTRHRAFDTDGRVVAETDAAGEVVRFDRPVEEGPGTVTQAGATAMVRNAAKLVTSVTKSGTETRYEYDSLGRVVLVEDDHGVTEFGWTLEGDLAWRENPDGSVEKFAYDGEGNLVESLDATGRRTFLEYGAFDLVTARIDDAGNRTGYAYDTELRLATITDPEGRTWRYTYDPNGRMVEETDFDGRTQRYAYDAAGQLVAHTDAAGEVTRFSYDVLGRVVERRTGATVTRLAYDAAGRVVAADDADSEIRLARDAAGRVVAETVNGRTVASSYSEQFGAITGRTRPSGASTQWSYDESGRPAVLVAGGEHLRFAYDGPREVSRVWDAGLTIERDADPAAALAERPGGHGAVRYTVDALGRPAVRSGADGDWHLSWNHQGRLASVTTPRGDRWRYRYDAFGRRIAKQLCGTDGAVQEETEFVWSGGLLVEQHHRDRGGRVTTTAWEYHPAMADPVAQITDGAVHAVLADVAGAPMVLVGTDGSRPVDPDGVPLRLGGRYLDAETGLEYDGSRYFDPATDRFLVEPRVAPLPVS
ncbi:RHS repeat-associated core domain-containing protein [Micromonospora matsumotoense]|uniref:RHS repeat-associated core domain-containing protein n=1 Tax=Micromonospora matsumotoense TaxID=121616 RepID=A0A1C5A4H5_9ACTN|nr:DUF6531 domain-containing protein [Micromonospora matsumotoense]SCF40122.1 RHS repeat-associated core domain-containing protein [Micromonospora matsumotoense]